MSTNGPDPVAELTCDQVREMAGSFVLGALDPAEAEAVRAHLATCTEAHEEIAELGGVLPVLAESVPVVEPPLTLKARILAAAAADLAERGADGGAPAVTPSADPATATGGGPAPAAATGPAGTETPPAGTPPTAGTHPTATSMAGVPTPFPTVAEREARRSRASRGTWALRIAAVVAIVALGGWNLLLQNDLNAAKSYEQNVAAVIDVASKPGSVTAILAPAGGSGAGLAAVSASGAVTLAMQGLAPTTGDTVYEAWVIGGDGVPVPIGSFKVGTSGIAYFQASGVPSTSGIVLALTREPGPGAKTPTLPIISKGVATAAG